MNKVRNTRKRECTAVIVTFNSADTVDAALYSLYPAHHRGIAECIVVDNASSDDTVSLIRAGHSWVRLLTAPNNLGYGLACNYALEFVRTPYVLFMNPDVQLNEDAIERFLEFAQDAPRLGLAGPALKSPESGKYQPVRHLPTPGGILQLSRGKSTPASLPVRPGDAPMSTDWICGAVMFAPTSALREVGGFDPRFFLYFEETDLCRRMALAAYDLWIVPSAVASHSGAASTRTIRPDIGNTGYLGEHYYPSRFYYLAKHHGPVRAVAVEAALLLLALVRDLWRIVTLRRPIMGLVHRLRYPVFVFPPKRDALNGNLVAKLRPIWQKYRVGQDYQPDRASPIQRTHD